MASIVYADLIHPIGNINDVFNHYLNVKQCNANIVSIGDVKFPATFFNLDYNDIRIKQLSPEVFLVSLLNLNEVKNIIDKGKTAIIFGANVKYFERHKAQYAKNILPIRCASYLASKLGIGDGLFTTYTTCADCIFSLYIAKQLIEDLNYDFVIVGFSSDNYDPLKLIELYRRNIITKDIVKLPVPFSEYNTGLLPASACALLVVASEKHVPNFKTSLKIKSFSFASDASRNNLFALSEKTLKHLLSRVDMREISFIKLHGSCTPQNDRVESNVFSNFYDIPKTAFKGIIGHALTASSHVELALMFYSIQKGLILPCYPITQSTNNGLNLMTKPLQVKSGDVILVVNYGFGGTYCAITLEVME